MAMASSRLLRARISLCGHIRFTPPFERLARRSLSSTQASGVESTSSLDAEYQHQKRLKQETAQSMHILYCRDHSVSAFWKSLRALTVDVSCDFKRWRSHQSSYRNLALWMPKNIRRSDNIRRLLFPDLFVLAASSSFVCYFNCYLAEMLGHALILPTECFTLTSVALGLLVTFKTQTAYARFIEGRNLWGLMINESRAFSSRILVRVPGPEGNEEDRFVANAQKNAVKLIRTFPFTVKYHVTEDGCNPHIPIRPDSKVGEINTTQEAELKRATSLALRAELQQIWDIHDVEEKAFLEKFMAPDVGNRPLQVLHEMSRLNAEVFAHPNGGALDHVAATEMDRSITRFHDILGANEKILRTPIYSPYTRFTGRCLYVWCGALPCALYPMLGPIGTVPAVVTISFFMLGIEDIGCRVEQPFNVMPLWQYCDTIDQSCVQLVKSSNLHSRLQGTTLPIDDDDIGFNDIPSDMLKSWADPLDYDSISDL